MVPVSVLGPCRPADTLPPSIANCRECVCVIPGPGGIARNSPRQLGKAREAGGS